MPGKNSERFLIAFNQIEEVIKGLIHSKEYITFSKSIDLAKEQNATIKQYEEDLRKYAELRNAIVHHTTSAEHAIAEPHKEVVDAIEELAALLTRPVTVGTTFVREVYTCETEDPLSKVLDFFKDKEVMPVPIYKKGHFQGMITPKGLVRWLANAMGKNRIPWKKTTMGDVLRHEMNGNNYRFVASKTPIQEAEELFKEAAEGGHMLEAILITRKGKKEEPLTGMITALDLINID